MSKTFCPVPWIFQAVRSNGDVRVCCHANGTPNKGVVRKQDGTPYNAGSDDLDESRNSKLLKNMRLNMINGIWSDECARCKREEESGMDNRRKYEQQNWDYSIKHAIADTAEDGSIDVVTTPVKHYDLRFGNFCNLKCRMCGPTDSSAWYEDWTKVSGSNQFKETSGIVTIKVINGKFVTDEYNWPDYEPFWERIEANVSTIKHVYFAGGEPMLIERHYDFLDRCVALDAAKDMILEYNTNMTTLPTRVLDLWKKFKQVKIGASVDGMGAMIEYQRHPVKWEKVLKNLRTLDALPYNISGWLAFTVTAYNVNHMIDFMKWRLTESGFKKINNSKNMPIVSFHVAHQPHHLNIQVLPVAYKKTVTDKFEEFVVWCRNEGFPSHVVYNADKIAKGITSYMNSVNTYDQHWTGFVEYTKSLDSIRSESLLEVEPLFKGYYEP